MIRSIILTFTLLSFSLSCLALEEGDSAPQIIGQKLTGGIFALSRLDAKPKVINLFWVECKPCKAELPLLAKKEKEYPNVIFAAIHAELNHDTDSNYELKDIETFANSLEAYPSNLILGSERVKQQYDVEAFPASILLSADNKVEKVLFGFNDQTIATMEEWLKLQK